jgi:hypothetical protein
MKMQVIENEEIRPFDVDNCLVDYNYIPGKGQTSAYIYDSVTGKEIKVRVNKAMVRLLKEEFHRGGFVLVWSRSGKRWAKDVILGLGLEKHVHLVMSKPKVYFDDTPVKKWMRDRVFIDFDTKYKE